MAFREVSVTEIREVLRLWVLGEGLRSIERLVSCDRKTVRRYVQAAEAAGLTREVTDAIRRFIDGWNDRCVPFTWTKTTEEILAVANRKADSVTEH